ncbi:MAG: metallophosphoesterase family protein [Bacteroidota bacterium]
MDILHLSDLHIVDGSTLESHWRQAGESLGDHKFDFIVVSGDLTQSAEPEEYSKVHSFLVDTLMTDHLKPVNDTLDRARVIIVPGNHDINWEQAKKTFKKIDMSDHGAWQHARKECKNHDSDVRLVTEKENEIYSLQRISNKMDYNRRFYTFEKFCEFFYDKNLASPPHKHMHLSSQKKGDDYSLHVFDEHNVIFIGLNSCHKNDCYSHVACFNPEAVTNIRTAIRKKEAERKRKYILIGVWHHGIASGKGSHDYLDFTDLKELRRLGLHVGLHGHNHESSKKLVDDLDINILISGTGSLTAKGSAKPDGIKNEFSAINIEDSYLRLTTYELERMGYVAKPHAPVRLPITSHIPKGNQTLRPSIKCQSQRRTWQIDAEGVAAAKVELKGIQLESNSEIPLAVWLSKHLNPYIAERAELKSEQGIVTNPYVRKGAVGDNALRAITDQIDKGKYDFCVWEYRMSNQIALNLLELKHYSNQSKSKNGYQDVIAHVLAFETLSLKLSIEISTQVVLKKGAGSINAKAIVEKPTMHCGIVEWAEVPEQHMPEKPSISIAQNQSTSIISLSVYKPVVGFRYSISYQIKKIGPEITEDARKFRKDFTDHLRSKIHKNNAEEMERRFCSMLCQAFFPEVTSTDRDDANRLRDLFSGTEIIGLFWCSNGNDTPSKLRACFGNVPARKMDLAFSYGEGVAGHSYRFNKVATWFNKGHSSDHSYSAIYFGRGPVSQKWIICVPVGPKEGPPIGVISFSQQKDSESTPFSKLMYDFAESIYRKHLNEMSSTEHDKIETMTNDFRLKLQTAVHAGFWSTMCDTTTYGEWGFLENRDRFLFAQQQIPKEGGNRSPRKRKPKPT